MVDSIKGFYMGTVRYGIILLIGILFLATLTPLSAQTEVAEIQLNDRFERNITERGLTVVDWEGYISNPAILYTLVPPVGYLSIDRGTKWQSSPLDV